MKQIIKRMAAALCAGLLLTAGILPAACAAEETPAPQEEVYTLPSGRTIENVENFIQDYVNLCNDGTDHYGAALFGVFRGDEILFTGYYGETDKKNHIAADENACFEWGSITKTFIWVSAFQLYEQGRLDLDRDVRDYLPEGFFQHLSYDDPITMRNLMNHNAGWQETTHALMKYDETKIGSLKDELQAIEPAQIFHPGEFSAYSNYGAGVAGYVIECITGESFCDYVHEHIFEPLGMEHTAVNPAHTDNPWVREQRDKMHSYQISSILDNAIDEGTNTGYVPIYPAGAACGTLSDMLRYGQALVDESAPLFQHPETQQLMLSPSDCYSESDIPICCYGFWPEERAVRVYGHSGGTYFGQANLLFDPESKVGMAVMINESTGNWFLDNAHRLVFGFLDPEKYGSKSYGKAELKGYFTPARSIYRGINKWEHLVYGINDEQLGAEDMYYIQGGVLQLTAKIDEDYRTVSAGGYNAYAASLLGERVTPDNRLTAIESPSCDMLPDSFFAVKLSLLACFIIAGFSAVFLVRMRFMLFRAGRWKNYAGSGAMLAGQITRLVSVIIWLSTYVVMSKEGGGLPPAICTLLGVLQMLCVAVCSGTAVISLLSMTSKKEKALPARYLLHAAANAVTVCAVVYFEMYQFWGV